MTNTLVEKIMLSAEQNDSANMVTDEYNRYTVPDPNVGKKAFFTFKNRTFVTILTLVVVLSIVGLALVSSTYVFPKHVKSLKSSANNELYSGPMTVNLSDKMIKDEFGNIYKVLNEFQRDEKVFTEGLSWVGNDTLLESSGFWNKASIHFLKLDRDTKQITQTDKHSSQGEFFGEGSDVFLDSNGQEKIFQITWNDHKIFQFDAKLKTQEKTFDMPQEIPAGWAMTADWNDRSIAYIDTGDNYIYKAKTSENFRLISKIPVTDLDSEGKWTEDVYMMNEIEYVDGYLLCNQWMKNLILKIDPETGHVVNKFDFTALKERAESLHKRFMGADFDNDDVFNGIAYDKDRKTMYVTGKNWQKIFEIQIVKEATNETKELSLEIKA